MTAHINERTAWDLVRTVPQRHRAEDSPVRVHHHPRPDVWLQVHPSGLWSASPSPNEAARDIFDMYLPIQTSATLTIGQIGQSLDGRIATETGHSHYVTGEADIRRLHRLRALVDAVVVGAGTVAADNPRLTVREAEGDNPVRVVIDPDGQLERVRHVFSDGAVRTIEVRRLSDDMAPDQPPSSTDLLFLPVTDQGTIDPAALIAALRRQGLARILVEGGGVTVSRFLEAGVLDRLHLTVAPMLIGSGRPSLTLSPIDSLTDALRPPHRVFHLGNDVLFDLDLQTVGPRKRFQASIRPPGKVESSTNRP